MLCFRVRRRLFTQLVTALYSVQMREMPTALRKSRKHTSCPRKLLISRALIGLQAHVGCQREGRSRCKLTRDAARTLVPGPPNVVRECGDGGICRRVRCERPPTRSQPAGSVEEIPSRAEQLPRLSLSNNVAYSTRPRSSHGPTQSRG